MDFRHKAASAPFLGKIVHNSGIPILMGILLLLGSLTALAQIHGTPASVTSLGPNGEIRGIPSSVTSLGPFGWQTPRFRPPVGFHPRLGRVYGGRRLDYAYGTVVPYALPVYAFGSVGDAGSYGAVYGSYLDGGALAGTDPRALMVVPGAAAPVAPADNGAAAAVVPATSPAPAEPEKATVLVFLDGHRQEVGNYAIVGDKLYDLKAGGRRTIPLSQLDLPATRHLNEDRGTDFVVPPSRGG